MAAFLSFHDAIMNAQGYTFFGLLGLLSFVCALYQGQTATALITRARVIAFAVSFLIVTGWGINGQSRSDSNGFAAAYCESHIPSPNLEPPYTFKAPSPEQERSQDAFRPRAEKIWRCEARFRIADGLFVNPWLGLVGALLGFSMFVKLMKRNTPHASFLAAVCWGISYLWLIPYSLLWILDPG